MFVTSSLIAEMQMRILLQPFLHAYATSIGVNITAIGREIPLFECHPAFQLNI